MIHKLVLLLAMLVALLGAIYFELQRRSKGVLDTVKPQQVPAMRSAKTIRDYRQ